MYKKILLTVSLLFTFWALPASAMVKVIFDTDLGTQNGDIDDLGALGVLHGLANNNEAEILAVMLDHNNNREAISAVDAVNTFFNRPNIPIGRQDGSLSNSQYNFADKVAADFPHNINVNAAPGATWLYRKTLAAAADNSVVIVTVGTLRNIEALLNSGGDANSSLNGRALVNKKVKKIHTMGGRYPTSYNDNAESNFKNGGNCNTRNVVNNFPKPMYFNGFEVGAFQFGYETGKGLNSLGKHPLKTGYLYWHQNPPSWARDQQSNSIGDWSIWDQIAVYTAVRGTGNKFNEVSNGFNDVNCNGNNVWNTNSDKNHVYLTREKNPTNFADQDIEPLMKALPTSNNSSNNNSNNNAIAGNKRIKDGWKGYFLHAQANQNNANVQGAPLNTSWGSQKWVFEKVSGNTYRIKNVWTGRYLSVSSRNEWDVVNVHNLNNSWTSQQWEVSAVGNQYRIKNKWSGLYLKSPGDAWSNMVQVSFREWGSMKFSLENF